MGGEGHLLPLVSVGHALRRAGHDAMLVVPPALTASAERSKLRYRVGDEPARAFVDQIWDRLRAGPADAVVGLIDRELFAERCTVAMLPAMRETRDAWRPDVMVREPCEYASAVAAHEAGIPQAQVAISLSEIEFAVRAMVAPVVERFSAGVAAAIASSPYLSSFPPSLDPSRWSDTRRFRIVHPDDERSTGWAEDRGDPLVYMTFGTVLGEAALVVCHGGSGTTFGALAAGVPVVMCPLFADQPQNGAVLQRAGAGLVVGGQEEVVGGLGSLGPEHVAALRSGIQQVLGDPAYRAAAGRVAEEIARLPALGVVIEQLVRRGGGT